MLISDVYYSGHENPLKLNREFTATLMCTYDLAYYPFDTQRCPIVFYIQFYTDFYVTTKLISLRFSGTRRLLEYRVSHIIRIGVHGSMVLCVCVCVTLKAFVLLQYLEDHVGLVGL